VGAGVPRTRVYERVIQDGRTQIERPTARAAAPPTPQPDPRAVYRVPIDGAPVLGPDDALVTVVVFSDFQCPFCARVEPTLRQLRAEYGRDLRIVWMNNPLPFHRDAMPAAEAALEVFAQTGARGFWAFHDRLFENQQALAREDLERYAASIPGVRMPRFRAALDRHTHRASIEANQTLARQLGATGTPGFFINGRNLRGAQPIEAFRALVEEVRTEARARVEGGTRRARVYEETIANGRTEL
jgi:protein-disulfide isomerase